MLYLSIHLAAAAAAAAGNKEVVLLLPLLQCLSVRPSLPTPTHALLPFNAIKTNAGKQSDCWNDEK
jgi:rhamnose utilization protein RhaD (predicted bifunctional aldolase and dehydrogenase)